MQNPGQAKLVNGRVGYQTGHTSFDTLGHTVVTCLWRVYDKERGIS
jgi:hypothetical protein